MKRMIFCISLFLVLPTMIYAMEKMPEDNVEEGGGRSHDAQLADLEQQLEEEGLSYDEERIISVDDLIKNYMSVEGSENDVLLRNLATKLKSLPAEYYKKNIVEKIVFRGKTSQDQALKNIVLALEAINKNMESSAVIQEASYKQAVESGKTAHKQMLIARKQMWTAFVVTGISVVGFIGSAIGNIVQATGGDA